MKRNKVRVNLAEWGAYDIDGDLQAAIEKMQEIITNNPNCFDFKIDVDTSSGYYGDCSTSFSVYALRWETDDEYNNRIEAEKNLSKEKKEKEKAQRAAEAEEKRQRSLYETLKKKYENQQ